MNSRKLIYTVSRRKWDQNVFCNISYKTRAKTFTWFCSKFIQETVYKFHQNRPNRRYCGNILASFSGHTVHCVSEKNEEYVGNRILKIGLCQPKLWSKLKCLVFLRHSVQHTFFLMLQTLIFTGSSATVSDCLYILVHCSNFVQAVFHDYCKLQCPAWKLLCYGILLVCCVCWLEYVSWFVK